jgi:hypothetical protein
MTGIPNLIAGICFFLGGIPYKQLKEEQIIEGDEAIEKM